MPLTLPQAIYQHQISIADTQMQAVISNKAIFPGFDGDTLVHMPNGACCEIEYLSVGDLVLSRCEKTGAQCCRRILKKIMRECAESLIVSYTTGQGTSNSVYSTAKQQFWVEDVGWIRAGSLKTGQKISIFDPWDDSDEYRS